MRLDDLIACRTCGHAGYQRINPDALPELAVLVQRNGVRQVVRHCPTCKRRQFVKNVWHGTKGIPVIQDNRPGCCDGHGCVWCAPWPCEHCGSWRDLQTHHWAPSALFGNECNNWPTSVLCQPCHSKWHSTVTPNMRRTG